MFRRFLTTGILLTACALPGAVHAFSVSPLKYEVRVDPGKSETLTVEIRNDESVSKRFQLGVQTLRAEADGRRLFESGSDEAESWVKPDTGSFGLAPGQKRIVRYTVAPPLGTSPGAHSLALMIIAENVSKETIGISARTAIPLSLTVAGRLTEDLVISEWKSLSPISFQRKVPVHLVLNNIGSAQVNGVGVASITSGKDSTAVNVTFGSAIYPRSKRQISYELMIPEGAWPGPKKVFIDVEYGLSHSHVQAVTRIWYIPPYAITAFCAIVAFVIFFIALWRRTKKRS